MDGYSVTEAASVLGVPTERVWELLARGVLSGAPEGETGMRVYLQPRPAPAAPESKGPNGGPVPEPERELSPFRELLTEFRNLTERYGQALLALGESRGEVASLRSRVDLLEARMDLRLPPGSPVAPAWPTTPPFPAEHTIIPTAAAQPGPMAAATTQQAVLEPPDEGAVDALPPVTAESVLAPEREPSVEEERRHRARGPRRATESFAEALARAEDPSIPELPRGAEAAAAAAELRAGQGEPDETALPRELPAAEAMPVADEPLEAGEPNVPEPPHTAEEPQVAGEPDGIRWNEVGTVEAVVEDSEGAELAAVVDAPPPVDVTPQEEQPATLTLERDELPAAEAAAEPVASPDVTEPSTSFARAGGPVEAAEPEETTERIGTGAEGNAVPTGEPASAADTEVEEPTSLEWDTERYTTAIDEPDWIEAEAYDDVSVAPERAAADVVEPPSAAVGDAPEQGSPAADMVQPPPVALVDAAREQSPAVDKVEPPSAAFPDADADVDVAAEPEEEPATSERQQAETVPPLAEADETPSADNGLPTAPAVEADRDPTSTEPETGHARAESFPGSSELDRALDALRRGASASEEAVDEWPPSTEGSESASVAPRRMGSIEPMPPLRPSVTPRPMPPVSPAGRAYRRLRRIFPG